MPTIETHLERYVAATSDDIRMWSSGSLKRRLRFGENRNDWRDVIGTLWDQRVFGPIEDFRCACGKFFGTEYVRMVCDMCRVKVGYAKARTIRFGHINLPQAIPHPFVADAEPIDAIPIVPACFWERPSGDRLAKAYEEMLHVSLIEHTPEDLIGAYGTIIALLEPLYEQTSELESDRAERLARGMALKLAEVETDEQEAEGDEDAEPVDWDHLTLADD